MLKMMKVMTSEWCLNADREYHSWWFFYWLLNGGLLSEEKFHCHHHLQINNECLLGNHDLFPLIVIVLFT